MIGKTRKTMRFPISKRKLREGGAARGVQGMKTDYRDAKNDERRREEVGLLARG